MGAMYKRTAKAQHRKVLKDNEYAPTLATLSAEHTKSQWSAKTVCQAPEPTTKKAKKKAAKKRAKNKNNRNTLFGMRFR